MRKSNTIAIGLLAASIAAISSCTHPVHRHPVVKDDWDQDDYYVNDGYGYSPMIYHYPIFVNYPYGYYGGHISNRTSVVYRTHTGSYAATSGGRVAHASVAHGSVGHSSHTSRGGFGHSASSHSSHSSGS
jgi:hypothetical protein